MATADLQKVVTVPGRLCYTPTDLTLPFPHGGTSLGVVRQIVVLPNVNHKEVGLDPHGGEPGEVVYLGSRPRLVATFRGFDVDAVSKLFPYSATTPATQPAGRVIQHPGTKREGTLGSSSSISLLFSADNPEHPSALFYKAIPVLDPNTRILFQRGTVWEYTGSFIAIRGRDSQNNLASVAMGKLELLTL